MTEINWPKTEATMCLLPQKDLRKLIKYARRELAERAQERWAHREALDGAMKGMANVMAGAAWAMACRASLRSSKEHAPTYGVRAASGEMWLPAEILKACRLDIKTQHWSALTAPNQGHFAQQYRALHGRPEQVSDDDAVSFEKQMLENARGGVARFVVKPARMEARAVFDVTDGIPQ